MTIEELNKTYKELEEVSKSSDKYFYSKIQDFAREVENFYYQDKSEYKKTVEFIIDIYEKILPQIKSDTFGYKSVKDELTRVFLEIAGFGIGKELNVQEHFLGIFKKELNNKKLVDLIIKTLQKYLELQGTETSLSDDGKSMGISSFQVNLNKQVRGIRKQVHQLLLKIAKENKTNYSIVIDVITAIRNNIHSLAVILQNDKRAEAQQIISQELTESIKILEAIIKQYDGTKIEHLNIYHEISLAFWDPYDDKWEIKKLKQVEKLKDEIWSNQNYILFKAILRPGFTFSKEIPNIAKKFKEKNIGLLEEIIEFAENEKSIYNSIKTFFYYLGHKDVFTKIVEKAKKSANSPLWHYIGFGFSDTKKALDFVKEVEPASIIKTKALIDAFYHVGYAPENKKPDWQNQTDKTKKEVYSHLNQLIEKGTEFIKKDQKEIFWWSSSAPNTAQQVFDAKFSKESLALFEAILDDFSEKEEYSNYLFNAVANSIFYLREKLTAKDNDGLIRILKKFEKSGEPNQNTELFYQVVAKFDPISLVKYFTERLSDNRLTTEFYKRIPRNNEFVFAGLKDLNDKDVYQVLKIIAKTAEKNEKLILELSSLFTEFAKATKFERTINWLKTKFLKQANKKKVITAVKLLEDFDDYSDKNFWDFLKWVLSNYKSHDIKTAVWMTFHTGTLDLESINQKIEVMKEWSGSSIKNVSDFAEKELKRLEQERKEWLNE